MCPTGSDRPFPGWHSKSLLPAATPVSIRPPRCFGAILGDAPVLKSCLGWMWAAKAPSIPAFRSCMKSEVCERAGIGRRELSPESSKEWELDCPGQRANLPPLPALEPDLAPAPLSILRWVRGQCWVWWRDAPLLLIPGMPPGMAPAPRSRLVHPGRGGVPLPALPTGWCSHGPWDTSWR